MNPPDKFILYAAGTSPFKEVPLALTGLPKEEAGLPVHYLHKEVVPIGVTRKHPDEGYPIHVTTERAAKWVEAFKLMRDRGHAVPAPPAHRDRTNSYGKWIDLAIERNDRGGLSLFGTLKVVGDKAKQDVAGKDVSICTKRDLADDSGNVYNEAAEHIAVTPYPALTGLSGWTSIAASRGQAEESVPVFELAAHAPQRTSEAPTPQQESTMDLSALRKAVGAADTVPDADVLSQATAKIGEIPVLTTAKTTAETALATAKQELSRVAKPAREPDPDVLADRASLKRERVEHLITTGAISKHQGDFILSRVEKDGKPLAFNLSRAAGADESPVDALIAFAAMKGEGVQAKGEPETQVQELSRASADKTPDRQAELLKEQLKGYGLKAAS